MGEGVGHHQYEDLARVKASQALHELFVGTALSLFHTFWFWWLIVKNLIPHRALFLCTPIAASLRLGLAYLLFRTYYFAPPLQNVLHTFNSKRGCLKAVLSRSHLAI